MTALCLSSEGWLSALPTDLYSTNTRLLPGGSWCMRGEPGQLPVGYFGLGTIELEKKLMNLKSNQVRRLLLIHIKVSRALH